MPASASRMLLWGDNLTMLPRHVDEGSVDLVYLDPPFNSNASYNMLFTERDGSRAAAQIKAFTDTWRWDSAASLAFATTIERGGEVAEKLVALRQIVGESDMLAYLSMMAPRLLELRRVMRNTASLYLHCDPTASHYLKILLDVVFGPGRFRSEIVWKRSSAHSDTKQGRRDYGHIHDILLFYTKSDQYTWNPVYTPYDKEYLTQFYKHEEPETGRRYRLDNLTAAKPGGDVSYEFHGTRPYKGRYWAYSRQNMEKFLREGRLYFPKNGGTPAFKRFLDEMPGVPLQDVWTDIRPLGPQAAERLGYPTQKPLALLERIIKTSSNRGDVVLDPFCGCGTSIDAAERLERAWVGIDITRLAVDLIERRLRDAYPGGVEYRMEGDPTSVEDARRLALDDRHAFQKWVLGKLGVFGDATRGADRGVDGRLVFKDADGTHHRIVLSVKSGGVTVSQLRDLRGVLARENASIGVLVTLEAPTRAMRQEAASAGFVSTAWGKHATLQLLTVGDVLGGKAIDFPRTAGTEVTFKRAPKAKRSPSAVPQDLFASDPLAGTALSRQRKSKPRAHKEDRPSKTLGKPTIRPSRRSSRTVRELKADGDRR